MTFDTRSIDLEKLNSLTKYPSIPTYHGLGERGALLEHATIDFGEDTVYVTEKVDGANARVIALPDGHWIIGSRKELLYGRGDLIANPQMRIVKTLKALDIEWGRIGCFRDAVVVLYGEVYGAGVGSKGKEYAKNATGFRVFDIAHIEGVEEKLTWPREKISSWREHGGQEFFAVDTLKAAVERIGLDAVPFLLATNTSLPRTFLGANNWLGSLVSYTRCDPSVWRGRAEGAVVRTHDRKTIAKLRFEDYRRALVGETYRR